MGKSSDRPFDWERAVILELNSEHEAICRIHKVYLRPIAITLFDSDTLWGQFDNSSRTISISRKLVNEHPWQHVVGVFRHEMAHQFVAELPRPGPSLVKPHGEAFKEACRRLGVPEQYARAGLDLQSGNLDWKMEARNEAIEKILDKARKLLALGASTNEHEAHLAMERVRELYAKYNLEQMETLSQQSFVHLAITRGKKRMESWELRIISVLTEHFFVKVLLFQQFDAKTGNKFQAMELIGARENVVMAEYVYHFLLQQLEFLLKQALKKELLAGRSDRSSFRLGVLDGFDKKLKQSNKQTEEKPGANKGRELTVIGQALSKFQEDSGLADYLAEIYPRLGQHRRTSVGVNSEAFAAGRTAGGSINLNKPLSSSSGNQGKYLT